MPILNDIDIILKEKVDNYQFDLNNNKFINDLKILLLSAISATGKDTVKNELLKTNNFYKIISYTTREPRFNNRIKEEHTKDYYFITKEEMLEKINNKELIEVEFFADNIYATSINEFKKAYDKNLIALTDVDIKGARTYQLFNNSLSIFLIPPSYQVWQNRLSNRHKKFYNKKEINKRIKQALFELEYILKDNKYILVINDDLDKTIEEILKLIKDVLKNNLVIKDNSKNLLDYNYNNKLMTEKLIDEIKINLNLN